MEDRTVRLVYLSPLLMLSFVLLGSCAGENDMTESVACESEGGVEWGCRDQSDNNDNGLIDCSDPVCMDHPDCGGDCGVSDLDPEGDTDMDDDTSNPSTGGSGLNVTIFPAQPTPDDDLECRVAWSGSGGSDTDSGGSDTDSESSQVIPTYSSRWYVGSDEGSPREHDYAGPKLSSEHTGVGDSWHCRVTRYLDGVLDGEEVAATPVNVLLNHSPGPPGLKISVLESGDLLCLIDTPSEDDLGAPIRYSYAWLVREGETTAHRSEAGPIVAADQTTTSPGQIWTCVVTPSDGFSSGDPGRSQHEIPGGDCTFSSNGTQGYKFCSIPMSQEEAQLSCEGFGMDLVSIMGEAENRWVSDTASSLFAGYGAFFQRYWVGLEADTSSGTWYRSGGLEATYLEPALIGEASPSACGVTSGLFGQGAGQWQETSCDGLYGYVCEDRSYLMDSGDVALDGGSPASSTPLTSHGWIALYSGDDQVLSYTSVCSRGEDGLGLKTYRSEAQPTGVSVVLEQFESDLSAEVWAKPQDSTPMGALTVTGEDTSGNTVEVSLRTLSDGGFECASGSVAVGIPGGINYVSGNDWYRFLIEVGADGTARCQVSLEDGTAQEASLSVPQGAFFQTIGIHSLVSSVANETLTYWDDFKVGW